MLHFQCRTMLAIGYVQDNLFTMELKCNHINVVKSRKYAHQMTHHSPNHHHMGATRFYLSNQISVYKEEIKILS
jgi:hypothetical protein